MFKTRLLSGIVLVAAALVLIITGGDVLLFSTLLISYIGMFELYRIFHVEKELPGIVGYLAATVFYCNLKWAFLPDLMVVVLGFLMALTPFKRFKKQLPTEKQWRNGIACHCKHAQPQKEHIAYGNDNRWNPSGQRSFFQPLLNRTMPAARTESGNQQQQQATLQEIQVLIADGILAQPEQITPCLNGFGQGVRTEQTPCKHAANNG